MIKPFSFDTFKKRYAWKRVMTKDEVETLANQIFKAKKNGESLPEDFEYKELADFLNNTTKKRFKEAWKDLQQYVFLDNHTFYKQIGVDQVKKSFFIANYDVPYDNDLNNKFVVSGKDDNEKFKEMINDLDTEEEIIEVVREQPRKVKRELTQEEKAAKEADKKTKEEQKKARAMAAQEIVDNFEKKHSEESVEKQIKNSVTKIAKNKELMNLSKEQLKDYLRDAYEISDENALNNMMNAVVAKRAELLANKQLKHEELTEIDISKLQEQSQRDFEKKLQDQNLRYILPAQIEKRERLVQNRLNPELLKGGY